MSNLTGMKTLLLLLLPIFALAQPKGASQITVHDATFDQCVPKLVAAGYIIDKIDKDYKIIITKPKAVPKVAADMIVQVVGSDTGVVITGASTSRVALNIAGATILPTATPVQNRGMKGSEYRLCFQAMDALARTFGTEISYK